MNVPKNIKRFWMWVGIALLIELAAITLWKRWYWFFPSHSVSELYTKYAGTEGLNVAFVKDYRVNDTVFVDVTMLEATTDSAWIMLQIDFNVPIIPEEYKHLINNYNSVDCWLAPKEDYTLPMDTVPQKNDAIVLSRKTQTISIFHLKKETPIYDIFIHKLNEI
jgi:hypothetical protein